MAVDINPEDKEQAEAILRTFITENFPGIDTRKGSVFRSLVISPAASFYALMQAEQTQFRDSISLANIDTTTFDESVIEAFISNFFVTRKTGSNSTGIIRVDVIVDKTYTVASGTEFVTEEGLIFTNSQDLQFVTSPSVDQEDLFVDSDLGTLFFLVPVTSTTVTSVQVTQDQALVLGTTSFIDNAVVDIHSYVDFSPGTDAETIEEYKSRAQESITVRNLVTKKSIDTVIREQFAEVSSVQTIGYGDTEMLRDLVLPHLLHKGGDVDIFVRTGDIPTTDIFQKIVVSDLTITLEPPETPVFRIESVEQVSGEALILLTEDIDYTIEYSSTDLTERSFIVSDFTKFYSRFSAKEKIIIRFTNQSFLNQRIQVTVTRPQSIENIQEFVESDSNRVISANLLTRTMAPVFISMNIKYRVTGVDEPVDESSLINNVRTYVNSLTGTNTIEVSKIVQILEEATGIKSVVLPLSVEAEVNKTDGTSESVTTTDKLVIEANEFIGFSQRICQYILLPNGITLEAVLDE